jgi:hypothetical protein
MTRRFVNVRLDPQDGRRIRELRAHGISISSVVRRAIRAEALKLRAEPVASDLLLKTIMERHPTPEQGSRPNLVSADRLAVSAHILTRLHQRR